MSVFKFFNVQLLPLDTSIEKEVGVEGYRKLFETLRDSAKRAFDSKTLEQVSASLREEKKLAPFQIRVERSHAVGGLVKFRFVETIEDLYEEEEPEDVGPNKVDQRQRFRFLFEFSNHTLAIQLARGLPSSRPLIGAIDQILSPLASNIFPDHVLTVTEITSSQSLNEVLSADYYKRVETEVTFSNSAELDEELIAQIEEEARTNNIHQIEHVEKPARDAQMSSMSDYVTALLGLAMKYGNAIVRYVKDDKITKYEMTDYPVRKTVDPDPLRQPIEFETKLRQKTVEANEEAESGEAIRKKLRARGDD